MTTTRGPWVKYVAFTQERALTPLSESFVSEASLLTAWKYKYTIVYLASDIDPVLEEVIAVLEGGVPRYIEMFEALGLGNAPTDSVWIQNVNALLHRLRARGRTPDEI